MVFTIFDHGNRKERKRYEHHQRIAEVAIDSAGERGGDYFFDRLYRASLREPQFRESLAELRQFAHPKYPRCVRLALGNILGDADRSGQQKGKNGSWIHCML